MGLLGRGFILCTFEGSAGVHNMFADPCFPGDRFER